jgi:hypothetical protein
MKFGFVWANQHGSLPAPQMLLEGFQVSFGAAMGHLIALAFQDQFGSTAGHSPAVQQPSQIMRLRRFAVQSNLWQWKAARLIDWHQERAGTLEGVHDVLKNDLGAGVLPSKILRSECGLAALGGDGS